MTKKFDAKLPEEYYCKKYDNIQRFISYFYQIDLTKKLNPKKILEIGIGNKTVSNYLKQHSFDVTTCDLNKDLEPDYVADIRELPFENDSYDVVLAYEILEHIPWNDIDKALGELHRVTKKYVIISVPYFAIFFEIILKFPLIAEILKKSFVDIFFRMPLFFIGVKISGDHYWEVGRRNYPIRKVRRLLRKRFRIVKEIRPILNSYHHFFILEKYGVFTIP